MDFIQAVERRGVGAMELVAMDMKLRGTYIARQLSFHGVQFKVETVPIDTKFRSIYNDSVSLVSRLHQICIFLPACFGGFCTKKRGRTSV